MGESGVIPWPTSPEQRRETAARIAGALAECGVQSLTVSDPRACRTHELRARESNLPAALLAAIPGTTFGAPGVALLIDESVIRWVADGEAASAFRALAALPTA